MTVKFRKKFSEIYFQARQHIATAECSGIINDRVAGIRRTELRPTSLASYVYLSSARSSLLGIYHDMILSWFKHRRRAKILATPFPDEWNNFIHDNVVHDRQLTHEQQQRLRRMVRIFVAEKNWEGCGGLTVTDEIKVTIAAQACLLVVGMHEDLHFDHVLSILIYPTGYVAQGTQPSRFGLVLESGQPRLGEAWWRGPVILSWADAQAGGRKETPGHNLVLHEFAHQLDMINGRITDGTPPLKSKNQYDRWVSVLGPEFDNLVERCRRGNRGLIDCYGATNPAEFFAVITETFFESPVVLRRQHGEIYDLLHDYYCLDTAEWPEDF